MTNYSVSAALVPVYLTGGCMENGEGSTSFYCRSRNPERVQYKSDPVGAIHNYVVKRTHVREYGLTTLAPDGNKSLVAYSIPQGSVLGPVFSIIMRPSSLGGAALCVALCLSVCLSVRPVIVTERHVAPPSELQ